MRRLKRLAGMTNHERALLLRTFFIVGIARLSLWLLPVATARRVVMATSVGPCEASPAQSVWAVKLVSRYLPHATCLTQAIAVQALLARIGHDSRVEIGVAKDAGKFEAHAWVTCGDEIVIGGPDVARYSRLITLASGQVKETKNSPPRRGGVADSLIEAGGRGWRAARARQGKAPIEVRRIFFKSIGYKI